MGATAAKERTVTAVDPSALLSAGQDNPLPAPALGDRLGLTPLPEPQLVGVSPAAVMPVKAAPCQHPAERVETYPLERPHGGGTAIVTRCQTCGAHRVD